MDAHVRMARFRGTRGELYVPGGNCIDSGRSICTDGELLGIGGKIDTGIQKFYLT